MIEASGSGVGRPRWPPTPSSPQSRNSTASRTIRLEPRTAMSPSAISSTPSHAFQPRPLSAASTRGKATGAPGGTEAATWSLVAGAAARSALHVDLARRAAVGRGLIAREVFDGCRRHEGRDRRSQDGSGISHLDLGRRPRRLRRFRRCGAQQLRTRIHDRLPLAPRGLVLLGSGDTRLRGAMTNLLLHRGLLSGLEPAFAVAVETVDPALAGRRRLAGPRQALLFRFRGSRRRGLRGATLNQSVIVFEDAGDVARPARRTKAAKQNRK